VALISLRQLLECGVHFGHPTRKWNPKMAQFIYTKRNGIHILDLQQTTKFIDEVHGYVHDLISGGKTILFVGTKKQAQDAIREEATKCGMPYICQRWPGGLLTNRQTMRKRIERLRELRKQKEEGYFEELTKKDAKFLNDELIKLEKNFGGVADLEGVPDALFIVDVKKEVNAVNEAKKLGIPIIGILDTNCDPEDVDYKLPGNDDAIRSIRLFCQIIADSVMEAKYGYLPPDSVFIRAAEDADEDAEQAGKEPEAATEKPEETPAAEPPAEVTAKLELGGAAVEIATAPPAPEPAPVVPAPPVLATAPADAPPEPAPAPTVPEAAAAEPIQAQGEPPAASETPAEEETAEPKADQAGGEQA
jgi:small subunit ribosomal protein S2